ncbi:uncharacterized protein [Nicotiana sylvestris]|uniref:uncharacterized protein n=1 Tax=Nicotiana sylvestris TaxID=4096 RepID=UPI00388C76DC
MGCDNIISGEGIWVDAQKIEAVKTWPRPTTPMEIRSFLGLAGYYRRFVEGFSSLSALLTKLTQKRAKFQWNDACEQSFLALKDRLTSASNTAKESLIAEVKERQYDDPELVKLRKRVPQLKKPLLELKRDGVLKYRGRLCVPDVVGLQDRIMLEAHYLVYSIHPRSTKMYSNIKEVYCWNDMKKNIAEFVS